MFCCVMAAKRQLEDFDVSSMKQSPNAIVHSIVTSLSLIKKSKRSENIEFFSGLFLDGKGCKRLISFVLKLRAPLDDRVNDREEDYIRGRLPGARNKCWGF